MWPGYVGMAVGVLGVAMVSLEKEKDTALAKGETGEAVKAKAEAPPPAKSRFAEGYVCAALNVFFDAYASVLTKQHGSSFTTWEINVLRFGSAAGTMLTVAGFMAVREAFITKRSQSYKMVEFKEGTSAALPDGRASPEPATPPPPPTSPVAQTPLPLLGALAPRNLRRLHRHLPLPFPP